MTYSKGDTNPEKGRRYPTGTGYGGEKTRKPAPPKTAVPEITRRGYPSERAVKAVDAGQPSQEDKRTASGVASPRPTTRRVGSVKRRS